MMFTILMGKFSLGVVHCLDKIYDVSEPVCLQTETEPGLWDRLDKAIQNRILSQILPYKYELLICYQLMNTL
jgi:hypothetical protein